jgi:hypothetical protein
MLIAQRFVGKPEARPAVAAQAGGIANIANPLYEQVPAALG